MLRQYYLISYAFPNQIVDTYWELHNNVYFYKTYTLLYGDDQLQEYLGLSPPVKGIHIFLP